MKSALTVESRHVGPQQGPVVWRHRSRRFDHLARRAACGRITKVMHCANCPAYSSASSPIARLASHRKCRPKTIQSALLCLEIDGFRKLQDRGDKLSFLTWLRCVGWLILHVFTDLPCLLCPHRGWTTMAETCMGLQLVSCCLKKVRSQPAGSRAPCPGPVSPRTWPGSLPNACMRS